MLDAGLLVPDHALQATARMATTAEDAHVHLDDTRPWLLAFNLEGAGKDVSLLRAAIGEKRIDDAIITPKAF